MSESKMLHPEEGKQVRHLYIQLSNEAYSQQYDRRTTSPLEKQLDSDKTRPKYKGNVE